MAGLRERLEAGHSFSQAAPGAVRHSGARQQPFAVDSNERYSASMSRLRPLLLALTTLALGAALGVLVATGREGSEESAREPAVPHEDSRPGRLDAGGAPADPIEHRVAAFHAARGGIERGELLREIAAIGTGPAVEALAEIAASEPAWAETVATRIARIDNRRAAGALAAIVESGDRRGPLVPAAVRALGRLRLRRTAGLLAEIALSDEDPSLRRDAVTALGRIAAPESVEVLVRLLDVDDARLRLEVIRALGSIRTSRSLAALEDFASRTRSARELDEVRGALSELRGVRRPRGPGF